MKRPVIIGFINGRILLNMHINNGYRGKNTWVNWALYPFSAIVK